MSDGRLTSDDAKAMINEIEKQDDVRVARILRVRWDEDNDDSFLWSVNGCAECGAPGEEFVEGADGFVWARPTTIDKDCQLAVLKTYCSEGCAERAVSQWASEVQCDVFAAWHTL